MEKAIMDRTFGMAMGSAGRNTSGLRTAESRTSEMKPGLKVAVRYEHGTYRVVWHFGRFQWETPIWRFHV